MAKEIIQTTNAPEAIGPYSQAVRSNGVLYCSGQIPLDPKTMHVVGEDPATQTRQVMENLGMVLHAAGCSYADVVKCTIYLTSMEDFAEVNRVYGSYFEEAPPARETVAVRTLPKNVRVEISCVAT